MLARYVADNASTGAAEISWRHGFAAGKTSKPFKLVFAPGTQAAVLVTGDGLALGLGATLGEGEGLGDGSGLGLGDGEATALGEGEGDGAGVGVWQAKRETNNTQRA